MENTTNINDLPVDNNPPSTMELPEQNIRENPQMDESVYLEPEIKKRVRFSPLPERASSIQEKHKIIILATLFFLLFSDSKVKNYFMNILVVVFGSSLRTSAGGSSKIGQVAYSLLYGTSLVVLVSLIDFSSLTL